MAAVGGLSEELYALVHAACVHVLGDHTLACLPRHFRTAHLYRARAASSEPVTIGEGLWGPILNLGGSPLSVWNCILRRCSSSLSYLFSRTANETVAGWPLGGFTAADEVTTDDVTTELKCARLKLN